MMVTTFPLVWCEGCGKATEPPGIGDLGLIAGPAPLACSECGEILTLLECAIHPRSESWQAVPGGTIRHVATLDALAATPPHSHIFVSGRR